METGTGGERREASGTASPAESTTTRSAGVPGALEKVLEEDGYAEAWIAHALHEQQSEHLFRTAFFLGARFALKAPRQTGGYDGIGYAEAAVREAGALWRVYVGLIFRREDFENGLMDAKPTEGVY